MAETTRQQDQPPTRARTTIRDLLGSLTVLLAIVAVVVGVGRGCTFSPGGPTVDSGSAPTVDVSRELAAAASTVDFPVRRPVLPADWRANSSSVAPVGAGASVLVRVGWLTSQGFAQLSQSGGDPVSVVIAETGRDEAQATGEVDVDGVPWTVYPGRRDELAWVTRLGEVTTLITGSASEDDFRVLARAAQAAAPLPRG